MMAVLRQGMHLCRSCRHHIQEINFITNRYLSHFVPLTNRSLVSIHGRDSVKLLQGIITNDISLLKKNNDALFAMLLNVQGRVEYDLIVYHSGEEHHFLIECDENRTDDLVALMTRYKLRSKVRFDKDTRLQIYTVFGEINESSLNIDFVYKDPRLSQLGYRILSESEDLLSSAGVKRSTFDCYVQHRYKLGITEGASEVFNRIPLELNLDLLNGVSFSKGCYIGQELVARAHHTGVIRKRILPLKFSSTSVQVGDKITNSKGKSIGRVIGCLDDLGLGLVRLKEGLENEDSFIVGNNTNVTLSRPEWWPTEIAQD